MTIKKSDFLLNFMLFCLGTTVGRRIGDPYLMRHQAAKSADSMFMNLPHWCPRPRDSQNPKPFVCKSCRLHVSDSAFVSPYDSAHDLHTKGLGFQFSIIHPFTTVCKHISGKSILNFIAIDLWQIIVLGIVQRSVRRIGHV
jgi:hypothetical protein